MCQECGGSLCSTCQKCHVCEDIDLPCTGGPLSRRRQAILQWVGRPSQYVHDQGPHPGQLPLYRLGNHLAPVLRRADMVTFEEDEEDPRDWPSEEESEPLPVGEVPEGTPPWVVI